MGGKGGQELVLPCRFCTAQWGCTLAMVQTGTGRAPSVPVSLAEEEGNGVFNCLTRYFELIGISKLMDKEYGV